MTTVRESKFELHVVTDNTEKAAQSIVVLDSFCFPESWLYHDAPKYYRQALSEQKNICIFLLNKKETVGYILSIPHNDAQNEIFRYDSGMNKDSARYYIDSIAVMPFYRRSGGAKKLVRGLCKEMKLRGIRQFSIHARTKNHLNNCIKNMFKSGITETRFIENWKFGGGEPYEYIEWTC